MGEVDSRNPAAMGPAFWAVLKREENKEVLVASLDPCPLPSAPGMDKVCMCFASTASAPRNKDWAIQVDLGTMGTVHDLPFRKFIHIGFPIWISNSLGKENGITPS